jgi:CO/xanthine dehydrogenase FAD-binding subunit
MVLPGFKFHQPKTVTEAIGLLAGSSNAALIAGGTDLLVEMKKGLRTHENIISLSKIEELSVISEDKENIYIGSCVTHNEVIASSLIADLIPGLAAATSKIGSEQVRNTGTIGGNLCTAAACSDTAPVLLAMNASVEIAGKGTLQIIPLKDFFIFNKKTVLKPGELMIRIIVPKPSPGTKVSYEKFGLREAGAIAVVSVAAMVMIKNETVEDACIVIGAVAPVPKISERAGKILRGCKVPELVKDSSCIAGAADAAVKDSIPIDDIRGGAQFRRDVLHVLTQRAILRALEL